MTPLHIEIMLHYYDYERDRDFPGSNGINSGPMRREFGALVEEGLLKLNPYEITAKGRAYVEQLCKVEPPTKQVWVYEP